MTPVTRLPTRLVRWLLVSGGMTLVALALAGRADLPRLNSYLGVVAAVLLVGTLIVDPELARERLRRGPKGILRRASDEDRFLRENLAGYEPYAERVRFRLLPGVC